MERRNGLRSWALLACVWGLLNFPVRAMLELCADHPEALPYRLQLLLVSAPLLASTGLLYGLLRLLREEEQRLSDPRIRRS